MFGVCLPLLCNTVYSRDRKKPKHSQKENAILCTAEIEKSKHSQKENAILNKEREYSINISKKEKNLPKKWKGNVP